MSTTSGPLRIGEFARRVGVSPELLRAWERRYGLLKPLRSPGGFRLYTDDDAYRVARMRRALDGGLSAAEAAGVVLETPQASAGVLEDAKGRLLRAIEAYDDVSVHAVLDEMLAAFGFEAVLSRLILPTLRQLGLLWERDTLGISREHFASNLIRGRLLSLARLWGRGNGPLALLACPPGEAHDIGLLAFGLLLRSYGWRVLFLGANTPIPTLALTAKATRPALVVLTTFDTALLEAEATAVSRMSRALPLVLSGPGASDGLCNELGVRRLDGDLVEAAAEIARAEMD